MADHESRHRELKRKIAQIAQINSDSVFTNEEYQRRMDIISKRNLVSYPFLNPPSSRHSPHSLQPQRYSPVITAPVLNLNTDFFRSSPINHLKSNYAERPTLNIQLPSINPNHDLVVQQREPSKKRVASPESIQSPKLPEGEAARPGQFGNAFKISLVPANNNSQTVEGSSSNIFGKASGSNGNIFHKAQFNSGSLFHQPPPVDLVVSKRAEVATPIIPESQSLFQNKGNQTAEVALIQPPSSNSNSSLLFGQINQQKQPKGKPARNLFEGDRLKEGVSNIFALKKPDFAYDFDSDININRPQIIKVRRSQQQQNIIGNAIKSSSFDADIDSDSSKNSKKIFSQPAKSQNRGQKKEEKISINDEKLESNSHYDNDAPYFGGGINQPKIEGAIFNKTENGVNPPISGGLFALNQPSATVNQGLFASSQSPNLLKLNENYGLFGNKQRSGIEQNIFKVPNQERVQSKLPQGNPPNNFYSTKPKSPSLFGNSIQNSQPEGIMPKNIFSLGAGSNTSSFGNFLDKKGNQFEKSPSFSDIPVPQSVKTEQPPNQQQKPPKQPSINNEPLKVGGLFSSRQPKQSGFFIADNPKKEGLTAPTLSILGSDHLTPKNTGIFGQNQLPKNVSGIFNNQSPKKRGLFDKQGPIAPALQPQKPPEIVPAPSGLFSNSQPTPVNSIFSGSSNNIFTKSTGVANLFTSQSKEPSNLNIEKKEGLFGPSSGGSIFSQQKLFGASTGPSLFSNVPGGGLFNKSSTAIVGAEDEDQGQGEDEDGPIAAEDDANPNLSSGKYDYVKTEPLFKDNVVKFRQGTKDVLEGVTISLQQIEDKPTIYLYVRMANKRFAFCGQIVPAMTEVAGLNNSSKNVQIKKILSNPEGGGKPSLTVLKIQFKDEQIGDKFIKVANKNISNETS